MPLPAPILPSELQWSYRNGVERHTCRIATSAASEQYKFICTGPKRIRYINVLNLTTPDGINAEFALTASNAALDDSITITSNQPIPAGPGAGAAVQVIPSTALPGGQNISENYMAMLLELTNPDTDTLDILFEIVYVPTADNGNIAIDDDASVTAMRYP
jgi:hypothetical protein